MKTILMVEDEVELAKIVKANLEAAGDYAVNICSDSRAALGCAMKLKPDLILMDEMMPGLSGSEVVRQLKENEATRGIPVIFLTAIVSEEETEENDHLIGGEYFVSKPVKTEELVKVIEKVTV